jgi:hypothetical protein
MSSSLSSFLLIVVLVVVQEHRASEVVRGARADLGSFDVGVAILC